jgi:hypothetical protein
MTRYAVILADPPWRYRAWKGDRGMRTAESFYPTMTAADLHALRPRIDEWAERDCALFLWETPPALPEAMELVAAWGFIYTTFGFTWIKITKAGDPRWAWDGTPGRTLRCVYWRSAASPKSKRTTCHRSSWRRPGSTPENPMNSTRASSGVRRSLPRAVRTPSARRVGRVGR